MLQRRPRGRTLTPAGERESSDSPARCETPDSPASLADTETLAEQPASEIESGQSDRTKPALKTESGQEEPASETQSSQEKPAAEAEPEHKNPDPIKPTVCEAPVVFEELNTLDLEDDNEAIDDGVNVKYVPPQEEGYRYSISESNCPTTTEFSW